MRRKDMWKKCMAGMMSAAMICSYSQPVFLAKKTKKKRDGT